MSISHKDAKDVKNAKGIDNKSTYNEVSTKQDEKNQAFLSTASTKDIHNPDAEGEVMKVFLTDNVARLILGSLDGDLITHQKDDKESKTFSTEERQEFKLFGKKATDLPEKVGCQEAADIANFILRGEEKDKEEKDAKKVLTLAGVLDSVKKNPDLVRAQCIATDPLGRRIQGTLLQIIAMAGDVNLIKGEIKEEKDRGLVERLKTAVGLSDEEVKVQLEEVLTSKEAVAENEKRNRSILDAIKAFGEGIILKANEYKKNKEDDNNFGEFRVLCQPLIDRLEKALTLDPNKIIKAGYIFDLQILHDAAKWFEDNVKRFDGCWSILSDVFWVNGFGKLQSKLSYRDAQVIRAGIGELVEGKKMPTRSLLNSDGSSYFYNSSSRLGHDFYLGYYGAGRVFAGCGAGVMGLLYIRLENLCRAKTAALQSLCNVRTIQNRAGA